MHARLARDLAEDLGADVGWRPLGGIELFADPAQLEEVWRFNRARGCQVERLDEQALRDAEPGLDGGGEGLYFADDHRVDPLKLGAALWAAAVQQGASAAWGERVWRIAQEGEAVEVATTRRTHRADFAVLAAGAWTGDLAAQLGARIALRPVRGQQARFAGAPLRHLVRINGRHFIPDGRRNDRGINGGGGWLSVGNDPRSSYAICLGGSLCAGKVPAAVAPAGRSAAQAPGRASAHRPADGCAARFCGLWALQKRRLAGPDYRPNRRSLDRRGNSGARHGAALSPSVKFTVT